MNDIRKALPNRRSRCAARLSTIHATSRSIPREVLDRDYGCGDPTRDIRAGESVLDLGSGGGKVCFIAAQIAGAGGRVIGVDTNSEMLALARRSAPQVSSGSAMPTSISGAGKSKT